MLTDQDKELLCGQGIIILPDTIEHETYQDMLYALKTYRQNGNWQEIQLYCRSNGGDSRSALAISDLIRKDGYIVGHLLGEVASSAAVIWAACTKRVVYPNGTLFVHPVWREGVGVLDAFRLDGLRKSYEYTDRQSCAIFASASNKSADWWYEKLNPATDGTTFTAQQVVEELEMAQWATKPE